MTVDAPSELLAVGGTLSAESLLWGHGRGLLALPATPQVARLHRARFATALESGAIQRLPGEGDPWMLGWWSPDPRPVLTSMADLRVGRSLVRSVRRHRACEVVVDDVFDDLVAGCRADRAVGWMDSSYVDSVRELQQAGQYLVVGVRSAGALVGGVIGVRDRGVLSLDSAFGRDGLGRVAVVATAMLATRAGYVVDLQWPSAHVLRLVQAPISRAQYLALLRDRPPPGPLNEGMSMPQLLTSLREEAESDRSSRC